MVNANIAVKVCILIALPVVGFLAQSMERKLNMYVYRMLTSLYKIPESVVEDSWVMLSDILPTGFECGVLNGKIQPGDTVGIVGAGPIGLATLLTAQFYSPAEIIMIDVDDNRLEVAQRFVYVYHQ